MSEQGGGVRRAGLGMMLAFWALLIGLGTWWFQGWFEARENPNANLAESLDGGPLTLARNANGHFVATGRLNGEPVTMLLDTAPPRWPCPPTWPSASTCRGTARPASPPPTAGCAAT